jgi:pimeloyl-ACP methyl ester carboxylesterase
LTLLAGLPIVTLPTMMLKQVGEELKNNIEIIGEAICDRPYFGETLFIYGEKSNYVQQDEFDEIKTIFPEAQFVGLPNAGHWLHVEQAEMFMNETLKFLLAH